MAPKFAVKIPSCKYGANTSYKVQRVAVPKGASCWTAIHVAGCKDAVIEILNKFWIIVSDSL